MTCIECLSDNTVLRENSDGHYTKHCNDCGYEGGPYVSAYNRDDSDDGPPAYMDWGR